MSKLNDFAATVLFGVVCSLVGGLYGAAQAEKDFKIEKLKNDVKATEKYNKLVEEKDREQRASNRRIAELQTNAERIESNAKTVIDNLRADVRNRVVRVSVPVASCSANPIAGDFTFTPDNGQARAELLPETVLDLISIAADANSEVRRTNLCIDQYNEMKSLVDRLRNNKVE